MITNDKGYVLVPREFIDDHRTRDDHEQNITEAEDGYWVNLSNPANVDLFDDAMYLAHDVSTGETSQKLAARAFLIAAGSVQEPQDRIEPEDATDIEE